MPCGDVLGISGSTSGKLKDLKCPELSTLLASVHVHVHYVCVHVSPWPCYTNHCMCMCVYTVFYPWNHDWKKYCGLCGLFGLCMLLVKIWVVSKVLTIVASKKFKYWNLGYCRLYTSVEVYMGFKHRGRSLRSLNPIYTDSKVYNRFKPLSLTYLEADILFWAIK